MVKKKKMAVVEKKTAKKKTKTAKKPPRKGGRQANKWTLVKFLEIKQFLEEKKVAQTRFSATVGVTNSTFHNWKNKRCAPDPATQQKIRDVLDGKTPLAPETVPKSSGRPRTPRGAGSQTLAALEDESGAPIRPAKAKAKAKAARAKKTPSPNSNGGAGSGWEDLTLLGQFIRANEGRSAQELHQAVNMVLEVMV
jgi:DNA-binding transcriptional regulator YiaG